ncbi:hypothetical protein V2E39_22800 [Chryseobacterium arthrosphaerae]|uniref:Uncharacterized protein n=1 Tax=Chryseobacterium arthrosphaerae TaxID=651561 RepID=A0ABU7R621_9FLAO
MKELEELTREIREKMPRLMELKEGQRLITLISDEANDIYEGAYETIGIGAYLLENGDIEIGGYEYEIGKHFEIVGFDPMLNDVLEWMPDNQVFMNMTGGFWKSYMTDIIKLGQWDLSKPYLKDQSSELITFLYSLITGKQCMNKEIIKKNYRS